MKQKPNDQLVLNGLCTCTRNKPCEHCLFWEKQNTPSGRKALCERIVHFLAPKPFYQQVIKQTVNKVLPGKVIYDDQKDICTMLFESALFEDVSQGKTPFAYFLATAPFSPQEKTLYQAWQERTIFGFFVVDDIIPEKEIYLTDLSGKKRYRIYETAGTRWAKNGKVIMCRLVPFLQGWMITTETVVSYSNVTDAFKQKAADVPMSQFIATKKYHEDRERRMLKLTTKQIEIVKKIDYWVQDIEEQGGRDSEILQQSFPHMAPFKELLDSTTHEQMDFLCETYPGFYRFAKLVESVAQRIQDGTIKVPTVN